MTAAPKNPFQATQFLTSAANLSQCPDDEGIEVAFAGRSNAGKSSAINAISQQRKLAKTSKTPGRTQLLNFFHIGSEQRRFVDLPGYGYAKVPLAVKRDWEGFIDDYLRNRQSLVALVLIMDIRRPLTDFDRTILNWTQNAGLATHILLTKADKLKFGPAKATLLGVERELRALARAAVHKPTHKPDSISAQLFSATAGTGVEQARERLTQLLELGA